MARFYRWFTDPLTGARKRIWGDTDTEVNDRIARLRAERRDLQAGIGTPQEHAARVAALTSGPVRVVDVYMAWIRTLPEERQERERATWRLHLKRTFEGLAVLEATETVLAAWYRRQLDRTSVATARYSYQALQAAVGLAVRSRRVPGLIALGNVAQLPWDPFRAAKPGPAQRGSARTSEEAAALLSVCRQSDAERRRRNLVGDLLLRVLFLLLTGARQGEACGAAWCDLDLEPDRPQLWRIARQQPRGGTGELSTRKPKDGTRSQILHADLARALRVHRQALEEHRLFSPKGPVFPDYATGRFRTSGRLVKPERIRELVERAGLPDADRWVTHSLRKSFAMLELLASGDVQATRLRMGHSTMDMLMIYLEELGTSLPAPGAPALEQLAPDLFSGHHEPAPLGQLPLPPPVETLAVGQRIRAARTVVEQAAPKRRRRAVADLASLAELPARERARAVAQHLEATRARAYSSALRQAEAEGVARPDALERASLAGRRAQVAWRANLARMEKRRAAAESEEG